MDTAPCVSPFCTANFVFAELHAANAPVARTAPLATRKSRLETVILLDFSLSTIKYLLNN
jgi:hypothetical protein